MKEKEKLIQKWLDHDLTEAELKSFKTTDDFAAFEKINQAAQHFKAPMFDSHANYTGIVQLQQKKSITSSPMFRYTLAIAAVGLVLFGLFNFLGKDSASLYYAEIGSQKNISLPDTSKVTLNAVSTLSYNNEKWDRNIYLEGEAYFKVSKGETFSVHTNQGEVKVLGTQFTVKDRHNFFEVICYEGLVAVYYNNKEYNLPLGTSLRIENGTVEKASVSAIEPSWIHDISIFKSTPIGHVLKELERQYNIELALNNIDQTILFTGSFTHKNLSSALQSISIPLTLKHQINGNKVTLTKQ